MAETIGRYEIISELGRGGMATVYLALDPRFRRRVAIKVLPRQFTHDPKFLVRFEHEAQTIAALEHPAIVPVYDFGEHDDAPYLVMRYMVGGSLRDRLRGEPLPLDQIVPALARLAPALDEAHELGIIHRDLKPANVLFDKSDRPYLADFGIARLAEATHTMTVVGTPGYMSPEQVQGDQELDGRSDIYALGIMLYELLTGVPPYMADTPTKQMLKHVLEPVPDVLADNPALSGEAQVVIDRAMAKERDDRYATANEMVSEVKRLAGGPANSVPVTAAVDTSDLPSKKEQALPPVVDFTATKTVLDTPSDLDTESVGVPGGGDSSPPQDSGEFRSISPGWAWWAVALALLAIVILGLRAVLDGADQGESAQTPTIPAGAVVEATNTATSTPTPSPTSELLAVTDTSQPSSTPTPTETPEPTIPATFTPRPIIVASPEASNTVLFLDGCDPREDLDFCQYGSLEVFQDFYKVIDDLELTLVYNYSLGNNPIDNYEVIIADFCGIFDDQKRIAAVKDYVSQGGSVITMADNACSTGDFYAAHGADLFVRDYGIRYSDEDLANEAHNPTIPATSHPISAGVEQLYQFRYTSLDVENPATILFTLLGNPVVAVYDGEDGTVVALTSNLDWGPTPSNNADHPELTEHFETIDSNLAESDNFIFWDNMLRWLQEQSRNKTGSAVPVESIPTAVTMSTDTPVPTDTLVPTITPMPASTSVEGQDTTTVKLTFVTGDDGTENNLVFDLIDYNFANEVLFSITLDKPGDLQPNQEDVYEFVVPYPCKKLTNWRLTKPAASGTDDPWLPKERYIELNGTLVSFDRVFYDGGPLTSGDSRGGSYRATEPFKEQCLN